MTHDSWLFLQMRSLIASIYTHTYRYTVMRRIYAKSLALRATGS